MANAKRQILLGLEPWHNVSTVPAFTSSTIDANDDGISCGLQSPAALTITDVGFRVGTITGNPTIRASLQGVTTEDPNGTYKGPTNNAFVDFNPGAGGLAWSNDTWHWVALGEAAVLTRGEFLHICIEGQSGCDGSNSITVSRDTGGAGLVRWTKVMVQTAGTWTRNSAQFTPIAMRTSGGVVVVGNPISAISSIAITSASSPREVGIKFTLDAAWGATFELLGAIMFMTAGSSTMEWKLYDGGGAADTTVLQNISATAVFPPGAAASGRNHWGRLFDEATLSTLVYGNSYRLVLACTGTGTLTTYWLDTAAAEDMNAYQLGQNVQYTSRDSGGNWTDLATRRPFDWTLLLNDITEPSAGGVLVNPGMGGGCNG